MSAQFSYNQFVHPIAIVVFVGFALGSTGLSQINTFPSSPPSDSASQQSKIQGQSPATTPMRQDAPALLLKMCGPKNPAPCAQIPPRTLEAPAPEYSKEAR